jgi:glycogen phosphorylase
VRERTAGGGRLAAELIEWRERLARGWGEIRFGSVKTAAVDGGWRFEVSLYLGEVRPDEVRVEIYADAERPQDAPMRMTMEARKPLAGASGEAVYHSCLRTDRPVEAFTPRVIPYHEAALVPLEAPWILWYR